MANINLLPWRDERREELKKEFLVMLGLTLAFAVLIVFAIHQYYSAEISAQKGRNAYLQQNIAVLDLQIQKIKELEEKRAQLLDRMRVISDLQGNRPRIVHVFDQLVQTLPDGVFFTEVQYTEATKEISLKGTAESNNRVSSLMRALDSSEWFTNPRLTSVKANPQAGENGNDFNMKLSISSPNADSDEEAQ